MAELAQQSMAFDQDYKFVGYFSNVDGPEIGNIWQAAVTVTTPLAKPDELPNYEPDGLNLNVPCGELPDNKKETREMCSLQDRYTMTAKLTGANIGKVYFLNIGESPQIANISQGTDVGDYAAKFPNFAQRHFYKAKCEKDEDVEEASCTTITTEEDHPITL